MKETQSLNQRLDIFEYSNDNILRVNGTKENPWFNANDVTTMLGYKDTNQAIRKNVGNQDKSTLQNLTRLENGPKNSSHNSVWINESGLYSLIMRSRKQEAILFQRWVTSEVLPSIRKTGTYTVPQKTRTQQEITLGVLEKGISILKSIDMFDERDKLLFSDLTKSAITNNGGKFNETQKHSEEWAISRRLSEHFGITDRKTQNKCITFGKVLVSYYRDSLGEEPPKRQQFVNGTIRLVNCYYLDFWEEHGDELMKEYFNIQYDDDDEE